MKKIITLVLLTVSTICFSQQTELLVKAKIRSEGFSCEHDTISKKIILTVDLEGKTYTLLNTTIKNCEVAYPLPSPKKDRLLKLYIESNNYEKKYFEFELKAGSKGNIEIGEILLKKKAKE
ncbi:Lipoprotein [Flavobacterium branchiophilum]|uniref:Uncharacterized protein n=1 Tax=Flavobacterium branchiophilum (strain FL-15) TaxID=1034807 RepID=G2Z6C2_FLABF|nr:hypothetical protein [Flavobacterium branchiophilum]CCB70942.1 Hypothetical protein precursor [Flavobacterium branchiophilum FL-15]